MPVSYTHLYLPKYMIPQNFIALLEMPTTKNGKIDKKELKRKAIEFQKTFDCLLYTSLVLYMYTLYHLNTAQFY